MFFPENFKLPSKTDGYMKIQKGENRIRILSANPILGTQYWTTEQNDSGQEISRPHRVRPDEKIVFPENLKDSPQYFTAFVVWDYAETRARILLLTQKMIIRPLVELTQNKKWGDPRDYDIVITKTGEGKEGTKYQVFPEPKSEFEPMNQEEIQALVNNIDLNALYDGGDPFANL